MVLRQLPAWPSLCNDTHTLASRLHALQQLFGQAGASQLLALVPQAVTRVPTALEQQLQQLAHACGLNAPKDLLPLLCEAWHVTDLSLGDVQQRLGDIELLLGAPHRAWAGQLVVGSSAWLLLDLDVLVQRLNAIAAALQVAAPPALAGAAVAPINTERVREALKQAAAATAAGRNAHSTVGPSSTAGVTPLASVLLRPGAAALVATTPPTITARIQRLASLLQEANQVSPQAAEQQAVLVARSSPSLLLLSSRQLDANWARLQQRLPGAPPQQLLQLLAGSSLNMQRLEFLTEVALPRTAPGSIGTSSSNSGTLAHSLEGSGSSAAAPTSEGVLEAVEQRPQQQEGEVYTTLGLDEAAFLQRYPLYRPWEAARSLVAAAPARWGWARQYTALQQAGGVAAWLQGLQGHWGTALSLACNPAVQQALSKRPSKAKVMEGSGNQAGSSRAPAATGHSHSSSGVPHSISLQDLCHPQHLLEQLQATAAGSDNVAGSVSSSSNSGEVEQAAGFDALQHQWLLVPPSLQDMPDKQAWQLLAPGSAPSQRQAAVGAAVALAQQLLQYAAGVPSWQQQLVEWGQQAAAAMGWQHQQQVGRNEHTAGSAGSTATGSSGSASGSSSSSRSPSELHLRRQLWHQLQPRGLDGSPVLSPRLERLHFLQHSQQQEASGLWEALVTSDKEFAAKFPVYPRWAQLQGWVQDKLAWNTTFHEALQGPQLLAWLEQLEQDPSKLEQLQYLVEAPGGQEWRGVGLLEAASMPREQFMRMFPDAQYKAWKGISNILLQLDPLLYVQEDSGSGRAVSAAPGTAAGTRQVMSRQLTPDPASTSSSGSTRRVGSGGVGSSSTGLVPVNREVRVAQLQARMQWLHDWGRKVPYWGQQLQGWSPRSWEAVLQVADQKTAPRLEFLHHTGQENTAGFLQQLKYSPAWFDQTYPHFRLWNVVRNAAAAAGTWKQEWEALRGAQVLRLLEEAAVQLSNSSSLQHLQPLQQQQQQQRADVAAAQEAQSQAVLPEGQRDLPGGDVVAAAAAEEGTGEDCSGAAQEEGSGDSQGVRDPKQSKRSKAKRSRAAAASPVAASLTPAVVQQVSHALRSRLRHLQHANLQQQQQPSPQQQQQQQEGQEPPQPPAQGLPSLQQLLTLPQAQLVMQWPHKAVPSGATRARGNLKGAHGAQTARAVAGAPEALLGKEVVPPAMWNRLDPAVQQQLLARDAAVLRGLQTLAHTHGDWMEYLYQKATPRQWAMMAQKYPRQQQRVAFLVR
jgi:hypothetical protein